MSKTGKNTKILISTLGFSFGIIPELIGYTNPEVVDLYKKHSDREDLLTQCKEHGVSQVSEVWLITTDSFKCREAFNHVLTWKEKTRAGITIRCWVLPGVEDIENNQERIQMADLIYRAVFTAVEKYGEEALILSLAGGRKTMGTDIVRAASVFGCSCLLHVLDSIGQNQKLREKVKDPDFFTFPFSEEAAACFHPVAIPGYKSRRDIYFTNKDRKSRFVVEIPNPGEVLEVHPASDLYEFIEKKNQDVFNLYSNYMSDIVEKQSRTNFLNLYALPPEEICFLQEKRIGIETSKKDQELEFLQKLPKPELHCHMGGFAQPKDLLEIASVHAEESEQFEQINSSYRAWIRQIRDAVKTEDMTSLKTYIGEPKAIRSKFPDIAEPIAVCGVINCFSERPGLLHQYIYREINESDKGFLGIEIGPYEKLGDFQGSSLLQSEKTIRKMCEVISKTCIEENVQYIELRCSPVKYTRAGLSPEKVVETIIDSLKSKINFRLIFIASRHGKMSEIYQHVELVKKLLKDNDGFQEYFAGFDLAGAENERSPEELRSAFLPLMEDCINLTIHAGENEPVNNIWQAVYHLNADRVGHGLSLLEDPKLLERFKDKKIAIEMCPSSNYQIVGYRDRFVSESYEGKQYPLKQYLEKGLRVTINTDDPGISLTSLSYEYYKAACLSENGLSIWDILQIIKNGFRSAFIGHDVKKRYLVEAEQKILPLLQGLKNDG